MKQIYIAAPYFSKCPIERKLNVQAARYIGYKLAKKGFSPVMPTVNTDGFENSNTGEFWYEASLDLMKRCDAVYVLDGSDDSTGVAMECKAAHRCHIPVFITMAALVSCMSDD